MIFENSVEFAGEMDALDALRGYRNEFFIPKKDGKEVIYLCGNSLGLQPKSVRKYIEVELNNWETLGVEGHFEGAYPWMYYHKIFAEAEAKIVGALTKEVVVMNTLTVNLHLMMVSFYKPGHVRNKILMEGGAFPSDQHAMESQARFHGFDPEEVIIEIFPREGEDSLRTEDIIDKIKEHNESLALVMMGGVNYYTGQAYEMDVITKAGHEAGAIVGFDLAHAAGNIKLELHDWGVDFAVWCTYKYLNSGPGGAAAAFVHERWSERPDIPRFAGWWGFEEETRFLMQKGFKPMKGADGWQLSNAQIFPLAIHKASLDIFNRAGIDALSAKSRLLTSYLFYLLQDNMLGIEADFKILTPQEPKHRGAQVSILTGTKGREIFNGLNKEGIIADWREPNVIRVAPVPLYNTFTDVYKFVNVFKNMHNS
jgi:kynureninase